MSSKEKEKVKDHYLYAIASFMLGIMSLILWLFPAVGFPTAIAGLGLGLAGTKSSKRELSKIAVIICIIGLVLTVANAAYGIYLGYKGQLVLP